MKRILEDFIDDYADELVPADSVPDVDDVPEENSACDKRFFFKATSIPKNKPEEWYISRLRAFKEMFLHSVMTSRVISAVSDDIEFRFFEFNKWKVGHEEIDGVKIAFHDSDKIKFDSSVITFFVSYAADVSDVRKYHRMLVDFGRAFSDSLKKSFGRNASPQFMQAEENDRHMMFYVGRDLDEYIRRSKSVRGRFIEGARSFFPKMKLIEIGQAYDDLSARFESAALSDTDMEFLKGCGLNSRFVKISKVDKETQTIEIDVPDNMVIDFGYANPVSSEIDFNYRNTVIRGAKGCKFSIFVECVDGRPDIECGCKSVKNILSHCDGKPFVKIKVFFFDADAVASMDGVTADFSEIFKGYDVTAVINTKSNHGYGPVQKKSNATIIDSGGKREVELLYKTMDE